MYSCITSESQKFFKGVYIFKQITFITGGPGQLPSFPPLNPALPMCLNSPVATGGFDGLSPPNKAPSPPKLKHETLYISGVFVNF